MEQKLQLRLWPHSDLYKVCAPVDLTGDTEFMAQLEAMKVAMSKMGGVGLAANQVGLLKRMLVTWRPGVGAQAFVNPKLVGTPGEWQLVKEGCLSLPGYFESVRRCSRVVVESQDPQTGSWLVDEYQGIQAQALQHELEHLDGKIFLDRLDRGAKDRIRAAMRKARR